MRIVDLTKPLFTGMEVYPGDPEVTIEVVHSFADHPWLLRRLTLGSHTGTHVDAFAHMDEHGGTLDDIPLERFIGSARLVHPQEPLPAGIGLIFARPVDVDRLADLLAARPPFVGGEISEALERALLMNTILTFTDLANLDSLPAGRPFTFVGFPLRIRSGDGSPVRAVAILDPD